MGYNVNAVARAFTDFCSPIVGDLVGWIKADDVWVKEFAVKTRDTILVDSALMGDAAAKRTLMTSSTFKWKALKLGGVAGMSLSALFNGAVNLGAYREGRMTAGEAITNTIVQVGIGGASGAAGSYIGALLMQASLAGLTFGPVFGMATSILIGQALYWTAHVVTGTSKA